MGNVPRLLERGGLKTLLATLAVNGEVFIYENLSENSCTSPFFFILDDYLIFNFRFG
jgi:hypothetical protein